MELLLSHLSLRQPSVNYSAVFLYVQQRQTFVAALPTYAWVCFVGEAQIESTRSHCDESHHSFFVIAITY